MRFPSFAQLYPTVRCNHKCAFCFNRALPPWALQLNDMEYNNALVLLDVLKEHGIAEIDVMGGEPLRLSWMADFAAEATSGDIAVNISTNGSFPESVSRLARIDSPLLKVGFSIQGLEANHNTVTSSDSFNSSVAGIRKMLAKGKQPLVKSVLTEGNGSHLSGLLSFLSDLGVTRYFLLHEDVLGRKRKKHVFSFPQFMDRYGEIMHAFPQMEINYVAASGFHAYGSRTGLRCSAGRSKIAILPDGSVYPCNLFFSFSEFRLGNILEDGLEEIMSNPLLDAFKRPAVDLACSSSCEYGASCSGGCPAHSYFLYRRLELRDPRCKNSGELVYLDPEID